MKTNKKTMMRIVCLTIAGIMILSVFAGLAMQVAYTMVK